MGTANRSGRDLTGVPVLALALLLIAGCSAPRTSLIARGGMLYVDGSIGASQGAASGGASADALGLDSALAFQPRVDIDWEDWHLSTNAFDVDVDGTGTADARLEWNGHTIERDVPAKSTLGIRMITADFAWDPIPWDFMDVGIGAGLGALQFEAAILAENSPLGVGIEKETPMGYLLLRLAKKTPDWGIVLRLAGLSASFENDDITYYEADLMGSVRIWGRPDELQADLILGWRYLYADYTYQSTYVFETDPTLLGPYLGFAIVF